MDPEKELKTILTRVAAEQKYEDYDIKFKQISSDGANYTSHIYLATISAQDREDLKLFLKVAAIGEKIRSVTPFKIYFIESFFYCTLRKIYKDLEEQCKVPPEHRLNTPKFYAISDETYKEALVLEDLAAAGYHSYDRFKSITWGYATSSMQNLAKLHALSIAWSINDPAAFEELANTLKSEQNLDTLADYFDDVVKKAISVTREVNKERLQKFIEDTYNVHKDLFKFYKPIRHPVVVHGDYRPSNLMHRERESERARVGNITRMLFQDGTIEVISVDYQTLQIGNPIVDLVYFIFNGSDKAFRKRHFQQTLEHYYSELRAALQRLDVEPDDVYPREDFDYDLEQTLPFGLIQSMFCLLIVTVNAEDAPTVNQDMEIKDFAVSPNELYAERINDIIDDFIDMGIL